MKTCQDIDSACMHKPSSKYKGRMDDSKKLFCNVGGGGVSATVGPSKFFVPSSTYIGSMCQIDIWKGVETWRHWFYLA
jgi:hypothetical protein